MEFSLSEAIIAKTGKSEGSLRRPRGLSQNSDEISVHRSAAASDNQFDHLALKQMEESERKTEEFLDKDDLSTKCVTGNEKDVLPQMRGLSLKKRSMQEYVSTGTIEEDFSLDEQVERCFPRKGGGGGEREGCKWGDIQVVNLERSETSVSDVERMSLDLIKLRFSQHESRRKGKELFREFGYITMAASRLNR